MKIKTHFDIFRPLYNALANSEDMTASAKHLLWFGLFPLMNNKGVCSRDLAGLGKLTGMTRKTVGVHIKILALDGWITIKKGDNFSGKSSEYSLNFEKLGIIPEFDN